MPTIESQTESGGTTCSSATAVSNESEVPSEEVSEGNLSVSETSGLNLGVGRILKPKRVRRKQKSLKISKKRSSKKKSSSQKEVVAFPKEPSVTFPPRHRIFSFSRNLCCFDNSTSR